MTWSPNVMMSTGPEACADGETKSLQRNGEQSSRTPEERQREWMENFIQLVKCYQARDYNAKFAHIRLAQEGLRGEEEFASNIAQSINHFGRNRYRDILPYDGNRVRLQECSPSENEDGYINASHISLPKGKTEFIAAQAPLPSTLDEWWLMVDEQRVQLVVMLCKLVEMSKTKCERYWPEEVGKSEVYGDYEITLSNEQKFEDDEYILRTLNMHKESTNETRTIQQLHYREWPDHGCPTGETQLLNMIARMAEIAGQHPKHPVLVHCSAGVGRTGTIILVNHIRELIEQTEAFDIDILSLVLTLRRQRSSMVQTQDQYQFVHRCVAHYCRRALGLPDEPTKSEEEAALPNNLIDFSMDSRQTEQTVESDNSDEGGGTEVPDYPQEPRAPRGPEDLNGIV